MFILACYRYCPAHVARRVAIALYSGVKIANESGLQWYVRLLDSRFRGNDLLIVMLAQAGIQCLGCIPYTRMKSALVVAMPGSILGQRLQHELVIERVKRHLQPGAVWRDAGLMAHVIADTGAPHAKYGV
jgi:hypothetical protein